MLITSHLNLLLIYLSSPLVWMCLTREIDPCNPCMLHRTQNGFVRIEQERITIIRNLTTIKEALFRFICDSKSGPCMYFLLIVIWILIISTILRCKKITLLYFLCKYISDSKTLSQWWRETQLHSGWKNVSSVQGVSPQTGLVIALDWVRGAASVIRLLLWGSGPSP